MKKLLTLCFMVFAYSVGSFAQTKNDAPAADGPVLKFEKTHHNFGKIKEEDGPVSYVYKFKNTGKAPLKITNVQPSCGCTTPDWTKEEIAPGKEGMIKATYDVNHRPGAFNKSITVHSNANPNISLLTFEGEVLPRVKTLNDSFPQAIGNLRFEATYINFGFLYNNVKDTTAVISIVNTGKKPITIKGLKSNYAYVSAKKAPMVIKPGERAKFPINYNATLTNDYGVLFTQAKLETDDDSVAAKPIDVIADVHQFVPKMTDAEKAKAPKIVFETKNHEFGEIKQGEQVKTQFKFTNKGKQDLVIYKVKTTCGCTASDPEKSKLKAGESSHINVSFDSAGKKGKDEKTITVYTNDPDNPEIALKISANILTPEADKSGK